MELGSHRTGLGYQARKESSNCGENKGGTSIVTQNGQIVQLTHGVTVTVESKEVVRLLVDTIYKQYQREKSSMDKNHKGHTLYFALSSLSGRSDVDAVKHANRKAGNNGYSRIKVAEFRRWLPVCLSEVFADFLGRKRK